MRWSKPDEHLPGYWIPENEAEAEAVESLMPRDPDEEEP